ncbi:protein of unknown function [Vibrio tapetis subsp. tapetis]|uniref:Uncharacterized protein n=1 Tax=Vibrio tapetis subsp. tapetis TaxID=1671868 RepID=A0A2N8ZIB2_9VIBR|nr:protein of unknown function [Vibrio tapetis subsp. tapetis]
MLRHGEFPFCLSITFRSRLAVHRAFMVLNNKGAKRSYTLVIGVLKGHGQQLASPKGETSRKENRRIKNSALTLS